MINNIIIIYLFYSDEQLGDVLNDSIGETLGGIIYMKIFDQLQFVDVALENKIVSVLFSNANDKN